MRRNSVTTLRELAKHALDRQRQAVTEQTLAVEALAQAILRLDGEVQRERDLAAQDPRRAGFLPGYLQEQRSRRRSLDADHAAAERELARRVETARQLFQEAEAHGLLLRQMDAAERLSAQRREAAFLDWLALRRGVSLLAAP